MMRRFTEPAALVLMMAGVLHAGGAMAADTPKSKCLIVAHRGYAAVAPENTLAAIAAAVEAGADACEFDVRVSRDEHIVLIHDEDLKRTTNGRGKVAEKTLAQLRRLDAGSWKDAKYAGERLPTLDGALARLKDSACRPVVEIKVGGIAEEVVAAVRKAGLVNQAVVIAFSRDVVTEVRRIEPDIRCGWLSDEKARGTPAEHAAWLAARAAECGTDLIDLDHRILSAELVAELRRRGLEVWTWTVDDPRRAADLARWGVRAITTNDPARLRPGCRQP